MQEQHVFEYAVIRLVPRVEREEFLNVGVILYCRDLAFLESKFSVDERKLLTLFPGADISEINEHLQTFCSISKGGAQGGEIGKLNPGERFRWLTAPRSTIVQTSRVHPGVCSNAAQTMERLYEQMIS
jgi:hypothetical protein